MKLGAESSDILEQKSMNNQQEMFTIGWVQCCAFRCWVNDWLTLEVAVADWSKNWLNDVILKETERLLLIFGNSDSLWGDYVMLM